MAQIKITLDDWQKEILEARGHILLCTGRQVGKTTIFSLKAARRLLEKETHIVIVSLTEDQAELIIMMILTFLEQEAPNQICDGVDRPTKNKIKLRNGSTAISRPVGITGNSVRGFTGDILIIDEASRMNEVVFTAAKPVLLTTAGEIWLCSTPYGRQGYFWECFNNKERFKIFHISSEEVVKNRPISESWTQYKRDEAIKFLDDERKTMSRTHFGQEYLGLFLEELQQFFPDELITKVMGNHKRPEHIRKENCYLGVDLARMGEDESVFSIFKYINKKLYQVENQVTKRTYLNQSTEHILALNRLYDFNKIFVDSEGIGVGVFDFLIGNEETKRKTIPINNSERIIDNNDERTVRLLKQDLYYNLLGLMERGEIELLDDENIFTSLKSVQYEYTTNEKGKPFLKIFGNYTHNAEAIIRGAWCVKYKPLNIWCLSIKI